MTLSLSFYISSFPLSLSSIPAVDIICLHYINVRGSCKEYFVVHDYRVVVALIPAPNPLNIHCFLEPLIKEIYTYGPLK